MIKDINPDELKEMTEILSSHYFQAGKAYLHNSPRFRGMFNDVQTCAIGAIAEVLANQDGYTFWPKIKAPIRDLPDIAELGGCFIVYKISWTEHERGWGCRPDGDTLYVSRMHAGEHIKAFAIRTAAREQGGQAPDEYTQPDQDAAGAVPVVVSAEILKLITEAYVFEEGQAYWSKNGDYTKL